MSMKILGTKIDQKLGKQSPGKSCVVFYAEDPDVVKDVVSTKVSDPTSTFLTLCYRLHYATELR